MKHSYLIAAIRGSFTRSIRITLVRIILGVAAIGIGLLGSAGFALSADTTVNAASSSVCKPNTSYALPKAISLTSKKEGLTYVNDGTSYYHVGGANVTAIRNALNQCAPTFNGTGDYLSYTSYAVSWSYTIATGKNNTCTLSDVRVGLRVSQLMPSLLNKTGESKSVQNKWNAFRIALHTHEDGHTSVDIAQAKKLLANLQKLSGSCSSIATSAQQVTTTATNAFVTANHEHDTDTDYGRDQGAVF